MYVYPTPKEPNTPKGLYWCIAAFIFYLVYQIVLLLLHAWMSTIIWGPLNNSPETRSMVSLLSMSLWFIPLIVGITIMIIFFIGLDKLYRGKKEFGERHEKYTQVSIFILLGIIITEVIGAFMLFIMSISTWISFRPTVTTADMLNRTLILQSITDTIVAVLVAFLLILCIRTLARDNHKMVLNVAAILGAITPPVIGIIAATQVSRIIEWSQLSGFGTLTFNATSGLPIMVGSAFGMVTILLFLIVYKDVLKRIRSGELKPYIPPPTPVAWLPQPMPPMPIVQGQVIYGPPPAQPPPTQPPPNQPPQQRWPPVQ